MDQRPRIRSPVLGVGMDNGCGGKPGSLGNDREGDVRHMAGCWVEQMDSGKWAICWPDCTYMETGFGSKGAATRALNAYLDGANRP